MVAARHQPTKTAFDWVILILVGILLLWGLVTIFNASYYLAKNTKDNYYYFFLLQLVWIAVAVVCALPAYFISYRVWRKLSILLLLGGVALLVGVFFLSDPNAVVTTGAHRWISFGSQSIQPSEFIKPIIIIFLAGWLAKDRRHMDGPFSWEKYRQHALYNLVPFLIILGGIGVLVLLEPDLGTTIIIVATSCVMYMAARSDKNHLVDASLIITLGLLLGSVAVIVAPYRFQRFTTFLHTVTTGQVADPLKSGYQTQQILIGIGSGGLLGQGFGQSRQRFGYLVELTAFTDSIAAVIFEELGFVGAIVLLALFWFLFYRMLRKGLALADPFARLLVIGIAFWFIIQALLHLATNLAVIPVTGVPLPFMTYGGSSLVSCAVGLALVFNALQRGNSQMGPTSSQQARRVLAGR